MQGMGKGGYAIVQTNLPSTGVLKGDGGPANLALQEGLKGKPCFNCRESPNPSITALYPVQCTRVLVTCPLTQSSVGGGQRAR